MKLRFAVILLLFLAPLALRAQGGPLNAGCVGTDASGNIKSGCTGGPGSSIASIQLTTGTASIASLSCSSETTVTMTGLLTTSVLSQPTATGTDPTTVSGWAPGGTLYLSFRIIAANSLGWRLCNSSSTASVAAASSITWNLGAW